MGEPKKRPLMSELGLRIEQILTVTAPRPHREIPTTTMMTRSKTKRTKTTPTSRRSSANPTKISRYGTAIAPPQAAVLQRKSQGVLDADDEDTRAEQEGEYCVCLVVRGGAMRSEAPEGA
jgi:hypothetical protein